MSVQSKEFDRFVGETEFAFRMLHRYLKSSERAMEAARSSEKEALEKQAQAISGEFVAVVGAFIDHAFAHEQEIPRILRYGHIIAIYSLFERQLKLLCAEVAGRRGNLTLLPEHLNGYPNAGAYQIFLTKVVDSRISVWNRLDTVRLARNCIAHGDGFIDGLERGRSKLRGLVSQTKGLSETTDGRLQVDSEFVDEAFEATFSLFTEAFQNLGFGLGWPTERYPDDLRIVPKAGS